MNSGIYKIENTINGNCYIGSAISFSGRWATHTSDLLHNKHYNTHLQRAYNKYGKDSFNFSILEECNKEQLIEKEQQYIDAYDFKNLYNIARKAINPMFGRTGKDCPTYGRKHTEEAKKKISDAHKGKIFTEEHKNNLSKAHKGKPAWNKGIPRSEETKEKLRQINLGKKYSKETKLKMSESTKGDKNPMYGLKGINHPKYGKKCSEESKQKMKDAWKLRRLKENKNGR